MVSQQQQQMQMGGTAATVKAKSKAGANINLLAVQRVDPCAVAIIDQATQTALYKFNQERHQWEKTDIEGSMFVYQRADKPWYSLLIANRHSPADLIEPLTSELQFKLHTPYLLMCKADGTINGLWFYDQADCERMAGQLNRLVADRDGVLRVSQTPVRPSSATAAAGGGGVLGLLSKAQSEYGKSTTSSVPNVVRPKAVKASGAPAPQEHGPMPAMLQKLFSEKKPEQPTVTPSVTPAVRKGTLSAEELEKELQSKPVDAAAFAKSTPMRLDSIPVTFELGGPSGSASPAVKPAEINARELFPPIQASRMSTASLQGSTTMLGVGVMETSTPRTSADNDPLLLDEMRSAAAELSLDDSLSYAIASEQLLRPADLMARQSVSVNSLTNGGMRLGASAFTMEHERPASVCARPNGLPNITPLTQEQMVQGFVHLLKTDAQFVGKLHQAYVESLNMGLSFGR